MESSSNGGDCCCCWGGVVNGRRIGVYAVGSVDLMDVIMEDNVCGDDDGLVLCVVVGLVGEDGRLGCLNVSCVN